MALEVHVHIPDNVTINLNVTEVISEQQLASLSAQVSQLKEILMATAADLHAKLVEVNSTTDEIAADIADLKARLASATTPAEIQALSDELDGVVTKLKGVAAEYTPESTP